jgi:hypothetical protein
VPPPGSAPSTPIRDSFNRADSSSLGSAWSSPAIGSGESSCRILNNQCRPQGQSGPSSSYLNTIFGPTQEAYCTGLGSGSIVQVIVGLTAVGYAYRLVNDQPAGQMRIVRSVNGNDTTVANFTTGQAAPPGGGMWLYMEPSGSTGVTLYGYQSNDGITWTQVLQVTDTGLGSIPSSYTGLRLTTNGQCDNFGGGTVGVQGQAVPAVATASSLLATGTKSFGGQGSPGVATAVSPGASPRMAPVAVAATSTAGALPAKSKMVVNTTFGVTTSASVCATSSTSIPAYPPIQPPTPAPPPPPPDPRDVPALDGPFTYLMYNALLPLAWADEDLGWPMLNFFKSIAYIVHEPYALAVDPGWQLVVDIDNVPSKFLDWLAQFVGIPTITFRNLSNDVKRAQIVDAPGWHRGTRDRMVKAAQSTLTGNKNVFVYERYDPNFPGQDRAYHITFITYASETPSSSATLAALTAAKPGGLQMTLLSRAGQIWMWFRDHYPPTTSRTWAVAKSDYADWEHARDVTYY